MKIIGGGGFYSAIPQDMMEFLLELDYGCVGEAYETFPELLNAIDKNEDPSYVKGIFYRKDGEIKFTDPRSLIADMDWLPFPAYKYAPLDIYFKNSGIIMSEDDMFLLSRFIFFGHPGSGLILHKRLIEKLHKCKGKHNEEIEYPGKHDHHRK